MRAFCSAGCTRMFTLGVAMLCAPAISAGAPKGMPLDAGVGVRSVVAPSLAAPGVGVPVPVTDQSMNDEIVTLARAVATARRTPIVLDWDRRLVGLAEARAAAESIVRGAVSADEAEVDEKMFQRLGLLAAGAGIVDLLAGAIAREPIGFYDPATRRLYVPNFIPLADQRPTLAHEIAHALQDQRFGLRRFLKGTPDGRRGLSFDGLLARQALIEGDAAVLAMEAIEPTAAFPSALEIAELAQRVRDGLPTAFAGGGDQTDAQTDTQRDADAAKAATTPAPPVTTPATPRFLREILAFPYSEGFTFVARARALAPWSAIDAMWARPPESTAQILHPEMYDRRQSPPAVELPPLPLLGEAFRLARTDTLGELLLRIWLSSPIAYQMTGAGTALPLDVAERAATGWRGDRMAIYLPVAMAPADQPGGDKPGGDKLGGDKAGVGKPPLRGAALAWLTLWGSDADADDFLQSVAPRLAALAAGGAAASVTIPVDTAERGAVWRDRAVDSVFAVQRRGTVVALLLGAPEAALPSLGTMLDAATPRREPASRRRRPRAQGKAARRAH